MKKTKLVILPLIAISLISCNKGNSNSVLDSSTKTSNIVPSSQTSNKSESSKPSSSSSSATTSSSTTSSTTSSSTSSSDDVYSKGWSVEITDLMLKHLGGTILPKINLGSKNSIYGEWDLEFDYSYGRLFISGIEEWDNTKTANDCASIYNADGNWDVVSTLPEKFEANSLDNKVHVIIAPMSSSDNTIQITATYDEPYDTKSAATAWDDEVQNDMIGLFGEVTDYVYLGLAYPTSSVSTNAKTGNYIQIFGGKWDDKILSDALGWKTLGFDVNIDGTNNTIIATKNAADGKSFYTYKVDKYGVAAYGLKIRLTIFKSELYNPSGSSEWSSTVKTCFIKNLNGHENDIPYVYLGTENPNFEYDADSKQIRLIGGTWNADILTKADSAYSSTNGWTTSLDKNDETFAATKTFADCNCVITIQISHIYQSTNYNYPYMTITIEEGLYIPSGLTDYATNTKTLLAQYFPDLTLPYVYLNLKKSATDTGVDETAMMSDGILSITGGEHNDKLLENMKAAFAADVDDEGNSKWTVRESYVSPFLSFEYTNTDGSVYQVDYTKIDNAEGTKKLAQIQVTKFAAYVVPESGDYDADVKTAINTTLHGHEIPYVYLYTQKEEYYSYVNSLQIWGGKFFKQMITAADTAFKAKGWDTTIASDGNSITATILEDDGCGLTMTLTNDNGRPLMQIEYDEPYFDKDHQPTAWTDTTTTTLTGNKYFKEIEIPYVYLGTSSESCRISQTTLTITGTVWNSKILTTAKATFSAAGWEVYDATYEGKSAVIMSKEGESNGVGTTNNFIVMIYRLNGAPVLKGFYEKQAKTAAKYPTSTATAWTSEIQAEIQTHNGDYNDIPYIDLGSDSISTDDSNDGFFRLMASANFSTNTRKLKAYNELVAHDNAEGTANKFNPTIIINGTKIEIHGKYERTDGSSVNIVINGTSSLSYLDIYYNAPFNPTATEWSSKVTKAFDKYFEGNTIPYFYIGSDNPALEVSADGSEIILTGETWKDEIYEYAINAFNNDKDKTTNESYWNYSYDYSDSIKGKQLIACKEVSTGTFITCKLYKNSMDKPVLEVYYVY